LQKSVCASIPFCDFDESRLFNSYTHPLDRVPSGGMEQHWPHGGRGIGLAGDVHFSAQCRFKTAETTSPLLSPARQGSACRLANDMKNLGLLLALVLPFRLLGQPAVPPPRLEGIVSAGAKLAVFECQNKRGGKFETLLSERQRDGDLEVLEINPGQGKATIRFSGDDREVFLSETNTANNIITNGIILEQTSLPLVIRLYERFSGRTALIWPEMPRETISLNSSAKKEEIAGILQRGIQTLGLTCLNDGERLVMIVPTNQSSMVKVPEPETAPDDESKSGRKAIDIVPAGLVDFRNADIHQVLAVYALLRGGQIPQNELQKIPSVPFIDFRMGNPQSKAEVLYCLDTLLAWRHVKVYRDSVGSLHVKTMVDEK
jgi:hypothetical protein